MRGVFSTALYCAQMHILLNYCVNLVRCDAFTLGVGTGEVWNEGGLAPGRPVDTALKPV